MKNMIAGTKRIPITLLFALITTVFFICVTNEAKALDIGGGDFAVEIVRDNEVYDEAYDLLEAVEIAENGDILRLISDTELNDTLTLNKNLSIDLNGFIITLNGCGIESGEGFVLDDSDKLREHDIIINGSLTTIAGGAIVGSDTYAVTVLTGIMTLKGGSVTGNTGGVKINADGGFILSGGSICKNDTDLFIAGNTVIEVNSEPESHIGVTLENPNRVFANSYSANVFSSNDDNYIIAPDKDGKAILGEKREVTFYDGKEKLFAKNTVKGGYVTPDAAPAKECQKFIGWVTESGGTADFDSVASDMAVYAKYSENHNFSLTPVWTWNSEFSAAEATFVCSVCEHKKSIAASITSEKINGETKYTATAEFGEKNFSDSKIVNDPPEEITTPELPSTEDKVESGETENSGPKTDADKPFDPRWYILIVGVGVLLIAATVIVVVKLKKSKK